MPESFSLTLPQKRFIFDRLTREGKSYEDADVTEWEQYAAELGLPENLGQIVKFAFAEYVKSQKENFQGLQQKKKDARPAGKPTKQKKKSKKSKKTKERVEADEEEDPEDIMFQTQANFGGDDDDDEENDSEEKEQQQQQKDANENETQQESENQNNQDDDDIEEENDNTQKQTTTSKQQTKKKRGPPQSSEATSSSSSNRKKQKTTEKHVRIKEIGTINSGSITEQASSESQQQVVELLQEKKFKVLGLKRNFPGGIIWRVSDQNGEESWVENRFMKYFYPDALFEYYEQRLLFA